MADRLCSIDGCDKPSRARGWCTAHWTRWKRHGSPTARRRGEVVDGKRICTACQTDKATSEFARPRDSWCRACFNDRQRERARLRYTPVVKMPAACAHCGETFEADARRSVFCSTDCFEVGRHKRNAKHVQARRARERTATIEPFFPVEVYDRDDWTCQLCGELLDRAAVKPHPRSPSVDHIIPLSRGGAHALTNVQAAHLGCNVRKGSRLTEAAVV